MFARKLAARGYDLLLIARREDRLQSLGAELAGAYHIEANWMAADLAVDEDLSRVERRLRDLPNLGLLVNNAGFGTHGFFWEADIDGQERMHRVHVMATMRLTHAALANQVPRNVGGVISVSSVAAFLAAPGAVSYGSTKAWINRFTEAISMELAVRKSRVKVQALCPGFTLSEFHDTLGMDRSPIPSQLWLTADFVVTESLRGFDQGKLFVIPGWRYKLLVAGMKIVPGAWLRRASRNGTSRYRKPKG
jgi:hypothetical protein